MVHDQIFLEGLSGFTIFDHVTNGNTGYLITLSTTFTRFTFKPVLTIILLSKSTVIFFLKFILDGNPSTLANGFVQHRSQDNATGLFLIKSKTEIAEYFLIKSNVTHQDFKN